MLCVLQLLYVITFYLFKDIYRTVSLSLILLCNSKLRFIVFSNPLLTSCVLTITHLFLPQIPVNPELTTLLVC